MNEEKMTAEEWHDLTWARDQVFDGKKVCHSGQETDSYFYVKNNVILECKNGESKSFASSNFARGIKWKLYEEPKSEFIRGQRVLVWNNNNERKAERRYFSHMEDNLYRCFKYGLDGWASEGKTATWEHCKAWEE